MTVTQSTAYLTVVVDSSEKRNRGGPSRQGGYHYFMGAFKAARGRARAHRPKKEFFRFRQENRGWAEEVGRSFLVRAA